jgi:hypothetical protein
MSTAAWFHPWWLLVWKMVNVMGLVVLYAVTAKGARAAKGRTSRRGRTVMSQEKTLADERSQRA